MVHALNEARRVLVSSGSLVDLRPVSCNPPIEILTGSGSIHAGLLDETPGEPDDLAADQAIAGVVRSGAFEAVHSEHFKITNYWETLDGLTVYAAERWTDSAVIPDDVLRRAEAIVAEVEAEGDEGISGVRIMREMHMSKYSKKDK